MLLLATLFLKVNAQFFEKTYTGQWGMTIWNFEFHKDGTFKRTSSGHFGNPSFQGTYKIYNDTIELVDGYGDSSGTLNKYYLMSKNKGDHATEEQGRIIDLTNLYEYYNNDQNYISHENKIVKVEITDSLNNVVKSFNSYIPINYLTNKYQIDLSWCVEFFNFPKNLEKAEIEKPDVSKFHVFDLDEFHSYDNQSRLVKYYYVGGKTHSILPKTMNLEYFDGTYNVKKITDSKDNSNYLFEYDNNGNISIIEYLTKDGKRISQLKITE